MALFIYMYFMRLGLLDGRRAALLLLPRLVRVQRERPPGRAPRSRKGTRMQRRLVRRAIGDVTAVCRHATPARGALDDSLVIQLPGMPEIALAETGGPVGTRWSASPDLPSQVTAAFLPPVAHPG